jgi:transcriptional regulator of arginine metabolism
VSPAGTTAARRRALRLLVAEETMCSQREVADCLAAEGYTVSQATVSRDLDAIGAVKEGDRDGAYRLADVPPRDEARAYLARTMAGFVREIGVSGNLAVIRTPPAAAQIVAGAIDDAGLDEVVGTVAGDDTVFVASPDRLGGRALAEVLEQIGAGR